MDLIEQVILYVADHRKPGSGTVLSKTPGIKAIDEAELLGWAFDFEGDPWKRTSLHADFSVANPESSTLKDMEGLDSFEEMHLYFHPLPSGCYALCRLSSFYDEENDCLGRFSHGLVITPRLLRAFHNNVLSIYRSLTSRSNFQWLTATQRKEAVPRQLTGLQIGVRHSPMIDTELLDAFRSYPGATTFANLLASSINSVCTVFTWLSPSIPLINGIIQCLPKALRLEISFSTSLHFSGLRPLRLMAVHENSLTARDICQKYAVPFFHLFHNDENFVREQLQSQHHWANLIYQIIEREEYDFLADNLKGAMQSFSFETEHGTPDWFSLNKIGKTLLGEFNHDNQVLTGDGVLDENMLPDDMMPGNEQLRLEADDVADLPRLPAPENDAPLSGGELVRGDLAHASFTNGFSDDPGDAVGGQDIPDDLVLKDAELEEIQKQVKPISTGKSSGPQRPISQRRLIQQFPRHENEIKKIDSLVARSLFGDQRALDSLEETWQELKTHLTFEESGIVRETYIHLIQSIIIQPRDPEFPKHPRRTIDSLEVMSIFLEE